MPGARPPHPPPFIGLNDGRWAGTLAGLRDARHTCGKMQRGIGSAAAKAYIGTRTCRQGEDDVRKMQGGLLGLALVLIIGAAGYILAPRLGPPENDVRAGAAATPAQTDSGSPLGPGRVQKPMPAPAIAG